MGIENLETTQYFISTDFFFFFLQLKAKFWISVPSYAATNNK